MYRSERKKSITLILASGSTRRDTAIINDRKEVGKCLKSET